MMCRKIRRPMSARSTSCTRASVAYTSSPASAVFEHSQPTQSNKPWIESDIYRSTRSARQRLHSMSSNQTSVYVRQKSKLADWYSWMCMARETMRDCDPHLSRLSKGRVHATLWKWRDLGYSSQIAYRWVETRRVLDQKHYRLNEGILLRIFVR